MRSDDDNRFILHYTGDLNYGFANAISGRLERLLQLHVTNKQAQKRFFSVFVEAIQNIRIHGYADADDRAHAGINVYTREGMLYGDFMNIITKEQGAQLAKRYNEANGMERTALKERYLDVMQNGSLSGKGGAGLGIITIVMRSQNPSTFNLINLESNLQVFHSRLAVNLQ